MGMKLTVDLECVRGGQSAARVKWKDDCSPFGGAVHLLVNGASSIPPEAKTTDGSIGIATVTQNQIWREMMFPLETQRK